MEEQVSLPTITRLISRLRADFGATFTITMAPVATALIPDPNIPQHLRPPRPMLASGLTPNPLHPTLPHLSGFSYPELECGVYGREIAWYNVQFYCGWGDAGTTAWYDAIISAGWAPHRVVLGVVTNPANGAGHIPLSRLGANCARLREKYGDKFGGVMGWEYFNAGDCDDDIAHVSSLDDSVNAETVQAGWVATLGRVLRTQDPPSTSTAAKQPSKKQPLGFTPEQIRQMVTRLPPPQTTWPQATLEQLVTLGFSEQEAVAALNATDGDVEMAAGFLFEQYPR